MTRRPADHRGYFAFHHDNPPAPFNPEADPKSEERYRKVTQSMQTDGYYATHSREECKREWARRYDELIREEKATSLSDPGPRL
jgi:hypothetical protein